MILLHLKKKIITLFAEKFLIEANLGLVKNETIKNYFFSLVRRLHFVFFYTIGIFDINVCDLIKG